MQRYCRQLWKPLLLDRDTAGSPVLGRRHRRQHVPGVDQLLHDPAHPGQHLERLRQFVARDAGDGRAQLVQHQLHPQLARLVLDDEQHLVVRRRQRVLRREHLVEVQVVAVGHVAAEVELRAFVRDDLLAAHGRALLQVTAARRLKRLAPFIAFHHLAQVLDRVPHVGEARVQRREAEAQDVRRLRVAGGNRRPRRAQSAPARSRSRHSRRRRASWARQTWLPRRRRAARRPTGRFPAQRASTRPGEELGQRHRLLAQRRHAAERRRSRARCRRRTRAPPARAPAACRTGSARCPARAGSRA